MLNVLVSYDLTLCFFLSREYLQVMKKVFQNRPYMILFLSIGKAKTYKSRYSKLLVILFIL